MPGNVQRSPPSSPEIKSEKEAATPVFNWEDDENRVMQQLDDMAETHGEAGPSSTPSIHRALRSGDGKKKALYRIGQALSVEWEDKLYEAFVIEVEGPNPSGRFVYTLAHSQDGSILRNDRSELLQQTKDCPDLPKKFVDELRNASAMTAKAPRIQAIIAAAKLGHAKPPASKSKPKKRANLPPVTVPRPSSSQRPRETTSHQGRSRTQGRTQHHTASHDRESSSKRVDKRKAGVKKSSKAKSQKKASDDLSVDSADSSPAAQTTAGPSTAPVPPPPIERIASLERYHGVTEPARGLIPRLEHLEDMIYAQAKQGRMSDRLGALEAI